MKKGQIIKIILDAITLNEVGYNKALFYSFSDADGVRTGKSGYSFGRSQFDIENNFTAIDCLRECGFSIRDIVGLIKQDVEIMPLNDRLLDASDVVDRYDSQHIRDSYNHCMRLLKGSGVRLESPETMIHIVDYHNQFYMSRNGLFHEWIELIGETAVKPESILYFKLNKIAWGKKRPDDVQRRFKNIQNVFNEAVEHAS